MSSMLMIQPDAGVIPVVQAIRMAQKRLDLCAFRLDVDDIETALSAAVERGVVVHALIAHTHRENENRVRERAEDRLLAAGVVVSRTADDLRRYHAKFMVVDDTLHVFGFNLTNRDILKSRSFGVVTRARKAVQEALKVFEADSTRHPYEPSKSNLVVSPENARQSLAAFIRGATRELVIYEGKIHDPAFVTLLNERVADGVSVRVIGVAKGHEAKFDVRPLKSMRLLGRAIVRDKCRVFVGSHSLRTNHLDSCREVGVFVNNQTVTDDLIQVFEADWLESATGDTRTETLAPTVSRRAGQPVDVVDAITGENASNA